LSTPTGLDPLALGEKPFPKGGGGARKKPRALLSPRHLRGREVERFNWGGKCLRSNGTIWVYWGERGGNTLLQIVMGAGTAFGGGEIRHLEGGRWLNLKVILVLLGRWPEKVLRGKKYMTGKVCTTEKKGVSATALDRGGGRGGKVMGVPCRLQSGVERIVRG